MEILFSKDSFFINSKISKSVVKSTVLLLKVKLIFTLTEKVQRYLQERLVNVFVGFFFFNVAKT